MTKLYTHRPEGRVSSASEVIHQTHHCTNWETEAVPENGRRTARGRQVREEQGTECGREQSRRSESWRGKASRAQLRPAPRSLAADGPGPRQALLSKGTGTCHQNCIQKETKSFALKKRTDWATGKCLGRTKKASRAQE